MSFSRQGLLALALFLVPIFATSQYFLWALSFFVLYLNRSIYRHYKLLNIASLFNSYSAALVLPCSCFVALSSRNAFIDYSSGLLPSHISLIIQLLRNSLYLVLPLLLCSAIFASIYFIRLFILAFSLGLVSKVIICNTLNFVLLGHLPVKGSIMQFPIISLGTSSWVGVYLLFASASFLLASLCFQPGKSFQYHYTPLYAIACFFLSILCFFQAYLLDNLSASIAGFLLLVVSLFLTYHYSLPSHLRNQLLFILIFLSVLVSSRIGPHHLLTRLRFFTLFYRNDRFELFSEGLRRFFRENFSIHYLFNGPHAFQRPICISNAQLIFSYQGGCNDYWHIILWDSFRTSGYLGLMASLIILICYLSIAFTLFKCSSFSPIVFCFFCLMFFPLMTTPFVESGASYILNFLILYVFVLIRGRSACPPSFALHPTSY